MLWGMIRVLARRWSLEQSPHIFFLTNEEQQDITEQHRYDECLVQTREDLGVEKKIIWVEIRRDRRLEFLYISHYI